MAGYNVTWAGETSKVVNNETVKSDEHHVGGQVVTIGIKSDNAASTLSAKIFVRYRANGTWFYADSIPNANLEAEDGVTGKTASITVIGPIQSFKLQVTTTQSETITAEYFVD